LLLQIATRIFKLTESEQKSERKDTCTIRRFFLKRRAVPHSSHASWSLLVIHFLVHPILFGQPVEVVGYEGKEKAHMKPGLYTVRRNLASYT
jgi:hypothetical protein